MLCRSVLKIRLLQSATQAHFLRPYTVRKYMVVFYGRIPATITSALRRDLTAASTADLTVVLEKRCDVS